MPLRPVDDSDPLLAFDTERGAGESGAPPLEPSVQPVAAAEDRPSIQQPPDPTPALLERIASLERELDQSKSHVAALQSEKATLVGKIADIRAPQRRPPAAIPSSKSLARLAAAVAGLAIGITIGVGGWMYFESDGDVSIAAPAIVAAAEPADYAQGLAPNVASAARDDTRGLAPNVASASARDVRGQPPKVVAPVRETYVGTLSIDADPGGEVFVDRKRAGQTPLRVPNLRAGSHLIWIERDGYRRFTRVVQVPADRVTRVSAELEPLAK